MDIIGLTGVAGSGKSTAAWYLVQRYGAMPMSFADYFKIPAVVRDGLPRAEVFGPLEKSPGTRYALQQRGTEQGRDVFGDDWWVRHWRVHLYKLAQMGVTRVVVDDVRFPNEAEAIHEVYGVVWRVFGRGGMAGEAAAHRSESGIATLAVEHNIQNSGSMVGLLAQLDNLMREGR